jgi:hypothetical protein
MLQPKTNNNIFGLINMLKSGNPQMIANQMMRQNPQFAQFVNENKGKSPEDIAKSYGIDINDVYKLMK